jgi:peptidoglycan/xylan/chitin deacetylase (PgdA/CDA1 family)
MIHLMRSERNEARISHKVLLLASLLLLQVLLVAALTPDRVTAAEVRVAGARVANEIPTKSGQGAKLLEAAGFVDSKQVPTVARVSNCRKGYVALTFDDGPSIYTPDLVRVLERLQIPATFFMVGSRVEGHRGAVNMVRKGGFGIGSHTWDHANLLSLRPKRAMWELRSTNRALAKAHAGPTVLVRPPYGLTNKRIRKQARSLGMSHVMWTVDSNDWRGGNARQIAARVLAQLRPHSANIVLQHDGLSRSPNSIRAVPLIVKAAAKRGYCFTSLNARGRLVIPSAKKDSGTKNSVPPTLAPAPGESVTPAP